MTNPALTATAPRSLLRELFAPYALMRGHREFTLLLGAHVISRVVQWLYIISLAILGYEISHSPGVVALLTLVRIIPNAAMLPISGLLIDRVSPRVLMIASLGGRSVCMLGLLGVHSRTTLPLAALCLFLASIFSAVFQPALMSSLPSVIDDRHLLDATSLVTQAEFLTQGIGPVLGGLLLLFGDIHLVFAVSAAAFALSALSLVWLHTSPSEAEAVDEAGSWIARTLGGFLFLLGEREHVLVALALSLAGIGVINGANYTLIVVLAEGPFHFGAQGADFLNGIYGIGSLLGGLVIGPLVGRRSLAPVFLAMAAIDCLASILFGFSPAGALPFIFMALGGLTDTATKVVSLTLIQIAAPRALYGRVFTAFESSLLGGQAFGGLIVGPLVVLLGPRYATFWLSMLGVVALVVTFPWLLRIERAYGVRLFLRNVPVLAHLAATALDDLASRFRDERFPAGATIVTQGDVGDCFYIVKRGHVTVLASKESKHSVPVASLSRMDYFGEIALLQDIPRTATVRAEDDVELYSFARGDFNDLLARSQAFGATLQGTAAARESDLRTKLLAGV